MTTAAALGTAAVVGQTKTVDAADDNNYNVKFDDGLTAIAAANQTNVVKLATSTQAIQNQQATVKPLAEKTAAAKPAAPTTYTVKSGDTISGIAESTGVSQANLVAFNNLKDANFISVGQVLKLTGTAATAAATSAPAAAAQKTTTQPVAVKQTVATTTTTAKVTATAYQSSATGNEAWAKATIAKRESGGSYTARNGKYYGKYQLSISYLNGDLSAANQERVADQYVSGRYGSWTKALAHSNAYGWY